MHRDDDVLTSASCKGLYSLKVDANILHRDVSVNNIMYEKLDGRYNFILIDFDMATTLAPDVASSDPTSKDRTGTLPFMARDLIYAAIVERATKTGKPIPVVPQTLVKQCLRHDFESLLYVCIWILCMFVHSGLTIPEAHALKGEMRHWENSRELTAAYDNKIACCHKGPRWAFSPSANALQGWFEAWWQFLRHSDDAGQRQETAVQKAARWNVPAPEFDWETLGHTFTAATLKRALTPFIPLDDTGRVSATFEEATIYHLVPGTKPADNEQGPANGDVDETNDDLEDAELEGDEVITESEAVFTTTDAGLDPSTNATTPGDADLEAPRATSTTAADVTASAAVVDAPALQPVVLADADAARVPAVQPPVENIRSRLRTRKPICYKE